MKKVLITVALFSFFVAPRVFAHPGGTDSLGCHTCHTNCSSWGLSYGEYHCHQAKSSYQPLDPISSHWGDNGTGYTTPNPSYSYPSYSSTPSCPSMSSYDSLSGSCKCWSGYVVGTDYLGNQSCVSADSKCTDLLGYGSRYNSLTEKCECRYGYIYNGNKCVSESSYCSDLLGLMSQYNSLTKQCECMTGYVFNGSECTYNSSSYSGFDYSAFLSQPSNQSSNYSCPENSTLNSENNCHCNDGYKVDSAGTACIKIICPENSTISGHECVCNSGYFKNGSGCYAPTDYCKVNHSIYDDTIFGANENGEVKCYCTSGYSWDTATSKCVASSSSGTTTTIDADTIIANEKNLTTKTDKKYSKKQAGKMLLQSEEGGTLWYVSPKDNKRYLLNSSSDLLSTIQKTAKIYTAKQVKTYMKNPNKVLGSFIVDKTNWKYYYVNPSDKKFYEVAPKNNGFDDYYAGFQVLKQIGIDAKNLDIRKIAVGG